MNQAALLDGLLAACALWLAWQSAQAPALRLGSTLLAVAATLGTLRFSGLLPLPALHQVMSMLGAAVALPLLAVAMIWPTGAVATQRRMTWVFAVVAATLAMMLVVQLGFKPWASACALGAVASLLAVSAARRQGLAAAGGACLLAALLAFAGALGAAGLQPGDWLHLGMAAGLVLLGLAAPRQCPPPR